MRGQRMMRFVSMLIGIAAIVAAIVLYDIKHDSRRLEAEVQALERAVEKTEGDITALKAERAWLARPDRIDGLARGQGLGPVKPEQYLRLDAEAAPQTEGGRAQR